LAFFGRYARGSHEIWRRDSDSRQTTIPNHGKRAIKRRTVKSILEDFKISIDEFRKFLKK
jgi:predicted RNA binding protein YcfA (HicA-like mRNA interferase family)